MDDNFIAKNRRVLSYDCTFELEFRVRLAKAKNKTVATGLLAFEFLLRDQCATYCRAARIPKF